jgi:hypothetical protein
MGSDACYTIEIPVLIQENGIVRELNGKFLARLDRDIDFKTLIPESEHPDDKHIEHFAGEYWFWDETATNRYGPYKSRQEARDMLKQLL